MNDPNKNNQQTAGSRIFSSQNNNNKKSPKNASPRPPRKITERYLHNAGLHYLGRFAASSGHFKTVMMRKIHKSCAHHQDQDSDACEKMLDGLIVKFKEIGLLDDHAYARGIVHSLRRKGLSSKAIHIKMRLKCVPAEAIKAALESYNEEHNLTQPELTAALRLCQRKRIGPFDRMIKNTEEETDQEQQNKKKKRQLAALARAGFSYEVSRQVLEMSPEDAEEYGFIYLH